ncbi:MAG TPA: SWIM zinc finger family protein, partial [Polyangiaceae bacterium]|nr:SWIM zinc finger family protein [Polyangiaceae bacterium]
MKGWNRWDVFVPIKQPPPAHGIKLKQAGTTWWGQRWIEALESVLRGHAGRLARGRTYARAGRTHDLIVCGGKVSAKVTGSRETPYEVTIELSQLEADVWSRAIAGMAARAQFAAELLGGRMPEAIDEVFRAAGKSLFPEQKAELRTQCSCPDTGDPCKHVASTHYLLGEALDRDPFLLFELRGRTKAEVMSALREARASGSSK